MSDELDPKEIVRAGYDVISRIYRGDEEGEDCAHYHAWLDELEPLLAPGSPVLDLGCGCGVPVARRPWPGDLAAAARNAPRPA